MNNFNDRDNKPDIDLVFQHILDLSSQCGSYFYMIYQPHDIKSTLGELIANKPLTLFKYDSYQIKYTPGLIRLDLTDQQDKNILKQSIQTFYAAIDPKAILLTQPRVIYGWIFSTLNDDVLAKQLGKVAIQPSYDGERLLRYFDPAVFSSLFSVFTDAQKQKLLNPVNYWLYLDSDGCLVSEKNQRTLHKHLSNHLGINNQQWQMIDWIEHRNQVLARYHFFHSSEQHLPEKEVDPIVFEAFKNAKARGYSEKQDLSEYAYRSLVIHPNFMEHPIIKSINNKKNYHLLVDKLHDISQLQWDLIAKECGINQIGVEQ